MEHRWERLTGPELKELAQKGALPLLPVGSLEQHGPHLPVWTDSFIAHAMCLEAARRARPDTPGLVLPPLWTGLSEHHLPFGGTITVDHATFHALLRCVARSLRACGFNRLLVVNGHGGNIEPMAVSVRELAHEFGMAVVGTSWPSVAPEAIRAALTAQPNVMHACEAETSLWLALDPSQVRRDRVEEAAAGRGHNAPAAPPGFSRFHSFEERAGRTGVRGDPRAATKEKGEAILAAVAEGLAKAMRDPALWSAPDDVWSAGRGLR